MRGQDGSTGTGRVAVVGAFVLLVTSVVVPATAPAASVADHQPPADPPTDRLGWEDGRWYNESIDADPSDGLNRSELEAYVARAMARVEVIRETEFRRDVPVTVVSRDEFRSSGGIGGGQPVARTAWESQLYEAAFIIGEQTSLREARSVAQTEGVAGFYSSNQDRIVIIRGDGQSTINEATLVHELTHALQDQYGYLGERPTETRDARLADRSVIEGDAVYVQSRFRQRCGAEWSCLGGRTGVGSRAQTGEINRGLLTWRLSPYLTGREYVRALQQSEGWEAVDARLANLSRVASTRAIIADETGDGPTQLDVEDRSAAGWEPYFYGDDGANRIGQAGVFSMLVYQADAYGAETVDPEQLRRVGVDGIDQVETQIPPYAFESEPSNGLVTDRLIPYHRAGNRTAAAAYVWVTAWKSAAEAREFTDAYRAILEAHDAEVVNASTGAYLIRDGTFADAFRVERNGSRVVVTNAPTQAALGAVRPASPDATALTAGQAGPLERVPTIAYGVAIAVLVVVGGLLVRTRLD